MKGVFVDPGSRRYSGFFYALLLALLPAAAMGEVSEAEDCKAVNNLLTDTNFASMEVGSAVPQWSARQHARDGSFKATASDEVLSIEKVGAEPWYVLTQRVREGDFAGKTLRYSAMMKFDITNPEPLHGFDFEAGLYLEAKNRNRRRVFLTAAEHEPNFGQSDWVEVSVEIPMPESAKTMEVGFTHSAGGVLRVRDPALIAVGVCPS